MKRSAFARKSPLAPMKPLRRTSMKRRPRRERPGKDDRPYLEHFIKRLPCCAPGCDADPPSDPHHKSGAGVGARAHDHETMPLCRRCHDDLDAFRGAFASWTREQRAAWQASMARVLRAAYLLQRPAQVGDEGAPTF